MINKILDEIFPAKCLICDEKSNVYLCNNCKKRIEKLADPKKYFVSQFGDIIYYYGKYLGPISILIKGLKYSKKIPSSSIIAKYLSPIIEERFTFKPSIIIPVPLSLGKLLKRKYNQCELIGGEISKLSGIKLNTNILQRRFDIFEKDQIKLTREDRINNLDNSFFVNKLTFNLIPSTIILLDDVSTTGKTIHACIETIKTIKPDIKIYPLVFAH
jgi:competence protein ComFC